jgi:hypothetical protein
MHCSETRDLFVEVGLLLAEPDCTLHCAPTGFDFRSGVRGNNPGVTSLVEAMSEQDIAALARYLAGS